MLQHDRRTFPLKTWEPCIWSLQLLAFSVEQRQIQSQKKKHENEEEEKIRVQAENRRNKSQTRPRLGFAQLLIKCG